MAQAFVQKVYEEQERLAARRRDLIVAPPDEVEIRATMLSLSQSFLSTAPSSLGLDGLSVAMAQSLQTALAAKCRQLLEDCAYKLVLSVVVVEENGQGIHFKGNQSWSRLHDRVISVSARREGFYCLINANFVKFHDLTAGLDGSSADSQSADDSSRASSSSEASDNEGSFLEVESSSDVSDDTSDSSSSSDNDKSSSIHDEESEKLI